MSNVAPHQNPEGIAWLLLKHAPTTQQTQTPASPMSKYDPRLGIRKDRHRMHEKLEMYPKACHAGANHGVDHLKCELGLLGCRFGLDEIVRWSGRLINPKPPKAPPQHMDAGRDSTFLLVSKPMRARGTHLIILETLSPFCSLAAA